MDISGIRKKIKESKKKQARKPEVAEPPEDFKIESISEKAIIKPDSGQADDIVQASEEEISAGEGIQDKEEFLAFQLNGERYLLRISDIEEILRPQSTTRVPGAGQFVLGITSYRGIIIPLMDLRKRLTITGAPDINVKTAKIIIISGPLGSIGMPVDGKMSVLAIGAGELLPPPSSLSEAEAQFVESVAMTEDKFVSVLNIKKLLEF